MDGSLVLTYVTLHSWKLNCYINNMLSNNNKQLYFAKNKQKLRQENVLECAVKNNCQENQMIVLEDYLINAFSKEDTISLKG